MFDGGLVRAQVRGARAAYEGTVDAYRQTVLSSFQQVEDEIVTLRVLEQEGVIEDETVKKAREAEALTLNQYKAGTVPYSSVITAQTTRLSRRGNGLASAVFPAASQRGIDRGIGRRLGRVHGHCEIVRHCEFDRFVALVREGEKTRGTKATVPRVFSSFLTRTRADRYRNAGVIGACWTFECA